MKNSLFRPLLDVHSNGIAPDYRDYVPMNHDLFLVVLLVQRRNKPRRDRDVELSHGGKMTDNSQREPDDRGQVTGAQ